MGLFSWWRKRKNGGDPYWLTETYGFRYLGLPTRPPTGPSRNVEVKRWSAFRPGAALLIRQDTKVGARLLRQCFVIQLAVQALGYGASRQSLPFGSRFVRGAPSLCSHPPWLHCRHGQLMFGEQ